MITCTKCGKDKPTSEFYVIKTAWCKECHQEYQLFRKHQLKQKDVEYLDPRRAKPTRSRYMMIDEWRKFKDAINEPREGLLWTLTLACALRISEVLDLIPDDFDFTHSIVYVKSLKRKGHPVIPVPVPAAICKLIPKSGGKLFPWTYHQAWRRFKAIAKDAGLDPRYSPHSLRHLAGTLVYDQTKDLLKTRDRLRHKSAMTTEWYTHISPEASREVVESVWSRIEKG